MTTDCQLSKSGGTLRHCINPKNLARPPLIHQNMSGSPHAHGRVADGYTHIGTLRIMPCLSHAAHGCHMAVLLRATPRSDAMSVTRGTWVPHGRLHMCECPDLNPILDALSVTWVPHGSLRVCYGSDLKPTLHAVINRGWHMAATWQPC